MIIIRILLLSILFFSPQIATANNFNLKLTEANTFTIDITDAPLTLIPEGGTQYSLASNPKCPVILGSHSFASQQIYALNTASHDIETIAPSSAIDTFIALYSPTFDPENPANNLITCDDDGGVSWPLSKITANLSKDTSYVVLVTTYNNTPLAGTINFQTTPDVTVTDSNGQSHSSRSLFFPVGNGKKTVIIHMKQ
ncbi:hypothetical protein [Desulfogranum japonicum]|uniref:hypothetical protein n=1 Tax=Desulfogranum japonicum TaxID=231447 RepID=UPI00048EC07D|nr:hypothetical protein [Desulfogranum japonicum]